MTIEIKTRPWNPTPSELAAYRAREVEMCVKAIKTGCRFQGHTLFSQDTWEKAQAQLGR